MKFIFCAVFLATWVVADYDNNYWPRYLRRCKPNAKPECFLVAANEALGFIIKGDTALGFPRYDQITLKNITFGKGQTWKLHFDEILISGFEHYVVTKMNWNQKKRTIDIDMRLHSAEVCNGDYESYGKYGDINVNGKGNMDLIFVGADDGGNVSYSTKYDLIKIDGREYGQIKDSKCSSQKGLRFNFNNVLKSRKETYSDIQYVNSNIDIGKEEFLKETSVFFCNIVDSAINRILYNFPLDMIFN